MGVEDEVGRHAIVAAGKSKIGGKEIVSRAIPNPPRTCRVKAILKTGKERLR